MRAAQPPKLLLPAYILVCLGLLPLAACGPTPTAEPRSCLAETQTRSSDGAEMICVPAGEFPMGSTDADSKAGDDEKPQHTVYLDTFWIDRIEVSNAHYVRFLNALGGHKGTCGGQPCIEVKGEDEDSHILVQDGRHVVEDGFEAHPIVEVTWYGAQAYCEWAGARLPTEAEWEKAARGTDGRVYPWGSDAPNCSKAHFGGCGGMTVPVGTKPAGASPYGALDMAGNVWEWVADWYGASYYSRSPAHDPQGMDSGEDKVFRGGSWGYPPAFTRTTERASNSPTYAGFNLGFRCAGSPMHHAGGDTPEKEPATPSVGGGRVAAMKQERRGPHRRLGHCLRLSTSHWSLRDLNGCGF